MGQLAIRNLTQTRIEGKTLSTSVGKIPSLVIVAAGTGSRRGHLLNLLKEEASFNSRVIAVCSDAERADSKPLRRLQVEQLACPAACEAVRTLPRGDDGAASILIDLSCLARQHIGALFSAIKHLAKQGPVDLQIAYRLARFVKPPLHWSTAIRRIAPVNNDFAGWTAAPDMPIELVIALGYEKGKAIGAAEYLEPGDTWLFVPTSPEGKYLREVQIQNKELLQERQTKLLEYEVLSPVDAYHSLLSLVRGMRSVARPILLPFGPKVFFGLSLLVALVIEEAAVWFVDGENTSGTDMGQPSPHAVIMSCRVEPISASAATTAQSVHLSGSV
ncbi:hypothetical protein QFZ42_005552 [Variovorax paradoxus]|uniref:hypothetical protein n=1 Tax=Variovorax paradoxus TaxID=34073 RepID=UPI0027922C76|nr:hypothetical protein [Variovorax paradoxus]MDQ0573718.1 hypothetical protein [Variovorax paradoxus]